jgi:hypothetical protein
LADTNTRATNPTSDYAQIKEPAKLTKLALSAGGDSEFIQNADAAFAKFAASGAKMIVYHGVNDQAMPYLETLKDYEELSHDHADIQNWLRVFTMPGLMHCRGGTGTTNSEEPLIDSLVSWVEKNEPPDTIIANKVTPAKGLERTFRLCAEPARAFLRKSASDTAKAENWECRSPQNQHETGSQHEAAASHHTTETQS